jgi:tight adherence protein B
MSLLIPIAVFVGVACLVGGVVMLIRGRSEIAMESRLAQMTGAKGSAANSALLNQGVLSQPLDATQGFFADLFSRFRNLTLLFEQADTTLTPAKFCAISGGLGLAGTLVSLLAGLHAGIAPAMGLSIASLPLAWLILRRRRRLKQFAKQLPDALELIARALRAGHSLSAGFKLVADEMTDPIGMEFNRVFEEQNLGIPMDQALLSMTDRVPNLDLKFFVTSLILQRQTGGDLAEILDKIGELIRERFKIWGQVQALTGEGRLSGIVLLALPPALFLAVYKLNPDYVMVLFSDPMGKQMLAGGVVLQILGALVIRKIVNIKV